MPKPSKGSRKRPVTKPRVLVTGATGFIGRTLVPELLKQGFTVTCLIRSDPGPGLWADCRVVAGDLDNQESIAAAVRGSDAVIHAAAILNAKDPHEYHAVNVEGTKRLVAAATKAKVKHFIFLSSVDVGHGTAYGRSKEEGERIVKESGIRYTILRPGPVYGPGDDKNIMEIYKMVATKAVVPVMGSGNNLRQPIHVEDLAASIIAVILSPKSFGKTYYLGGPAITYNDILAAIIEASGAQTTVVHLPEGLAKTLVLAMQRFGLGPNVSEDQVRTLAKDKIGDTAPFEQDFGVRARPFKQGITQVLKEITSGASP